MSTGASTIRPTVKGGLLLAGRPFYFAIMKKDRDKPCLYLMMDNQITNVVPFPSFDSTLICPP